MTPTEIIERATADGVNLALSSADTLTVTGDQATLDKWLPTIRDKKPGILMELLAIRLSQQTTLAKSLVMCELQRERRRAKVLAMLEEKRFALFVENDKSDPVIATVGIRNAATFELAIPRYSYDGMVLLELLEKHYGESLALFSNRSDALRRDPCRWPVIHPEHEHLPQPLKDWMRAEQNTWPVTLGWFRAVDGLGATGSKPALWLALAVTG